jgi:hypothetical protein
MGWPASHPRPPRDSFRATPKFIWSGPEEDVERERESDRHSIEAAKTLKISCTRQ